MSSGDTESNGNGGADSDGGDASAVVAALDRVGVAAFALDDEWRFVRVTDRAAELLERDGDVLRGESMWDRFPSAIGSPFYAEFQRAMQGDGRSTFEAAYEPLEKQFEVTATPEGDGLIVFFRDVTESHRKSASLSSVLEGTRALMQARSREEVAELVARTTGRALGYDYVVVRVYDADAGTLVPLGWTESVEEDLEDPPTYALDEEPPGEAFASGEAAYYDRAGEIDDAHERSVIGASMHLPIGVHGVVSIGAAERAAFDETDRQFAAIVATNAAVAFDRAKREEEAREARDRVETLLARINGLVRDILGVLVQATTREEIETGVCERFAAAEPYAFAWIGSADVTGDRLESSTWAGDADLDVAKYDRDLAGESADGADGADEADEGSLEPSARALRTGESQTVQDLADGDDQWREAPLSTGLRGLCAVPLTYRDTVYGVVTVYADRPGAFDERETVVLEALGRAIANAINAVERGRILSSNRIVEMELTSRDTGLLFSRLSSRADCRLETTGPITHSDGSLRLYVSAETRDPEAVQAALEADGALEATTRIASHEGSTLFEVVATDLVADLLADHGAVTRSLVGEYGNTRLTVELPHEAEARDLYDLLADRYDDVELVGYHEHDRPVQTRQELRASLRERFTDRQETALRSAYLGGFFDWPREVDGDALADAMGITRPTYHQHLRAAERKVFEELFE